MLVLLGIVGALLGVAVLFGGYWYFARDLPDFARVEDYRPPQVSRIHDADGTELAEFYVERRTVIGRDRIPPVMVQAILAAEDADFYQHAGLDYTGMLRAFIKSVRAGRIAGGGSTITQQTVKTLVLGPQRTLQRKARELILARRLESRLSKDDILTIYLNAIYFGHGRYGIHEAARYFFDKDTADLELHEAALLAGLVQSPERLSPHKHPEAARARRAYVLGQMADKGMIKPEAAEAAKGLDLGVAERRVTHVPSAMWYVDAVRREVVAALGDERLRTGGLRIYTALDPARQEAALTAAREGMMAIDARQKFARPLARVEDAGVEAWRSKRARALKDAPPQPGRPVPARLETIGEKTLTFDLGVGRATMARRAVRRFSDEAGRLPWSPGDVLRVEVRGDGPRHPKTMRVVPAFAPQAALVVLDPRTRAVVAHVGGWDHRDQPFDRVTQARRQPGSAFKPFVWGAAFASRRFTPATVMVDAPETYYLQPGKQWQPRNFTGKFDGPVTLRAALARSINSVAVKLANELGPPAIQTFAHAAGVRSTLADNLTIALGSGEVTPLELANAYATLAADGRWDQPRFITRIEGPDGPVEAPVALVGGPPADGPHAGIELEVAWLLRAVMRSVVTEGTAKSLARFPRPLVGKTGTSNDARDVWFVGALPDAVAVGWMGFDEPERLGRRETGGGAVAPWVGRYLLAMESSGPDWPPRPAGVESHSIEPGGRLAPPEAKDGREEHFLVGTAPREMAPVAGEVDDRNYFAAEIEGAREPPGEGALEPRLVPIGLMPPPLGAVEGEVVAPVAPMGAVAAARPGGAGDDAVAGDAGGGEAADGRPRSPGGVATGEGHDEDDPGWIGGGARPAPPPRLPPPTPDEDTLDESEGEDERAPFDNDAEDAP